MKEGTVGRTVCKGGGGGQVEKTPGGNYSPLGM